MTPSLFIHPIIFDFSLQALFDIAIVYSERSHNDSGLTNILQRQLESGNSYLMSIASEGCAKLLFTGVLTEPRLFAQLLKLFLIMEQPIQDESEEDELFTSLGSSTHMQQVLSVFFHAFFMAGDGREIIATESIGDVVADVCSMIRYGDINGNVLAKVVSQMISLCDSSSNKEIHLLVRQSLFAAISREILKSSPGKSDKAAIKEFVKALSIISPSKWIKKASLVPTVNKVISVLFKATQDKTSLKSLEKISDECISLFDTDDLSAEEINETREILMMSAPGLADLIEMQEDGDVASVAITTAALPTKSAVGGMARPKLIPRTPAKKAGKDVESEDEEEEMDEQESIAPIKQSSRPGRSTKAAAQAKMRDQLKENEFFN